MMNVLNGDFPSAIGGSLTGGTSLLNPNTNNDGNLHLSLNLSDIYEQFRIKKDLPKLLENIRKVNTDDVLGDINTFKQYLLSLDDDMIDLAKWETNNVNVSINVLEVPNNSCESSDVSSKTDMDTELKVQAVNPVNQYTYKNLPAIIQILYAFNDYVHVPNKIELPNFIPNTKFDMLKGIDTHSYANQHVYTEFLRRIQERTQENKVNEEQKQKETNGSSVKNQMSSAKMVSRKLIIQHLQDLTEVISYILNIQEITDKLNKIKHIRNTCFNKFCQSSKKLEQCTEIANKLRDYSKTTQDLLELSNNITNNNVSSITNHMQEIISNTIKTIPYQEIELHASLNGSLYSLTNDFLKQFIIKEENRCNICLSSSSEYMFIPCGHTMCKSCTTKVHNKCPNCRKRFTSDEVKPIFMDMNNISSTTDAPEQLIDYRTPPFLPEAMNDLQQPIEPPLPRIIRGNMRPIPIGGHTARNEMFNNIFIETDVTTRTTRDALTNIEGNTLTQLHDTFTQLADLTQNTDFQDFIARVDRQ